MFDQVYLNDIEERVFQEGMILKEKGKVFAGIYCAFTPGELIAAAGAVPVTLCAGSIKPIEAAEKHLPRNLCPLIKSSYGHALEDSCPYFHYVDLIFADATCDGKKKMFELLSSIKPVHVLQLPQTYEMEDSAEQWLYELRKMKVILERITGNKISDKAIKEQIKINNLYKKTVNRVYSLNKGEVPLLYGREVDIITAGGGFDCNPDRRIAEMEDAIKKVEHRAQDEKFIAKIMNKPRILLTGCPSTNKKIIDLIEESGAVIVAMETCGGLKTSGTYVEEEEDPMEALAEHYVKTACPCMTPNRRRIDLIKEIIRDFRIDGVIELTWHGCHTYNVEAHLIKKFVHEECRKKYLQIETDYSENDREQIRVRIEAFLELMR
ncbi:MAG: double-cubane-cluster-containing anaerobic reductase [Bacillota bacterium]|jgi:benzoyl-CoA reductase/2-hydroxyglutaryl-CoA dehydratase subunit BcrC/BadD/HgdB